jgi:hypothetical protein
MNQVQITLPSVEEMLKDASKHIKNSNFNCSHELSSSSQIITVNIENLANISFKKLSNVKKSQPQRILFVNFDFKTLKLHVKEIAIIKQLNSHHHLHRNTVRTFRDNNNCFCFKFRKLPSNQSKCFKNYC